LTPTTTKTGNYTAAVGELVVCNSASSSFTITPPASPNAGDQFGVVDAGADSGTNEITVDTSTPKLHSLSDDYILDINGAFAVFTYINATFGWVVND
jgi:hypothetical protein